MSHLDQDIAHYKKWIEIHEKARRYYAAEACREALAATLKKKAEMEESNGH